MIIKPLILLNFSCNLKNIWSNLQLFNVCMLLNLQWKISLTYNKENQQINKLYNIQGPRIISNNYQNNGYIILEKSSTIGNISQCNSFQSSDNLRDVLNLYGWKKIVQDRKNKMKKKMKIDREKEMKLAT